MHVVDSSWFSWRYEWSLHFGIGGPRFFPMVAITMISKRFYEVWYKSVLLSVIENMKQRWLVFCLSLLFTQIVKGPWRSGSWNQKKLRNRLLVIFFLTLHDYIWLLFICFLYCTKEGVVVKISKVSRPLEKSLPLWKGGRKCKNKFFNQSLLQPVVF